MNYKGLKILLAINFILFLVDVISTLRLGVLVQYLEINPLFKYIGMPGLIILNIVLYIGYYFLYVKWPNPNLRYIIMFTLVAVAITRIMVIPTNIEVGNAPPTIEEAKAISDEVKMQEAVQRLALPNFLPLFNGIFAFLLFAMDHNIKGKEDG